MPSALSPIPIEVESLCVRDGEVRLRVDPERSFELQRLDGCVQMEVADGFSLAARRLAGLVSGYGQPVLAIGDVRGAPPEIARAELDGSLRAGGTAELRFDGRVHATSISKHALEAAGVPAVRLSGWAGGGSLAMIPSQLRATLEQLDLAQVPYVCDRASGVVSGSIEARHLFEPRARTSMRNCAPSGCGGFELEAVGVC